MEKDIVVSATWIPWGAVSIDNWAGNTCMPGQPIKKAESAPHVCLDITQNIA